MTINLKPEYGTIFLTVEPPDSELYIDGKRHDTTTGRLQLTVRQHILEVRAKGYTSVTRKITPNTNYSSQVDIKLLPAGQAAKISAQPIYSSESGGSTVRKMVPYSGLRLIVIAWAAMRSRWSMSVGTMQSAT